MITVEAKNTSSPLSLGVDTKSSKSETGSFAALLHSLGSKTQSKSTENTPLILHLNDKKEIPKGTTKTPKSSHTIQDTKLQADKSQLLSLLKGEESKTSPSINPELLNAMDAKTLKSVLKDAKNYLKEQIQATDAFKKGEIKELPKTLQGLVEVAKKLGVDISKITVETVQEKNTKISKSNEPKHASQEIKEEPHAAEASKAQTPIAQTLQIKTDESKTQKLQNASQDEKKTVANKDEVAPKNAQTLTTTDTKTVKSEPSQEQKTTHTKVQENQQAPIEDKQQTPNLAPAVEEKALSHELAQVLDEKVDMPKHLPKQESVPTQTLTQEQALKTIPLFTMPQAVATHSTAELVGTKQAKTASEPTTTKAPSLLSSLLHGEKAVQVQAELPAEPKIKTPSSVLSQLLHGENSQALESTNQQSTIATQNSASADEKSLNAENTLHVRQSESDLSVKMNEAKQMTKYLAEDIKQAIEDYKAPFTRIKVKLNPEKLGEVDLTVVQRGKNIHVNISSNNSAIASLAQNANELKFQLTQNGMNNATLNFNSSTDTQSQQQQQQQHRQNEHQREGAKRAYEAFGKDEITSEEVLSSLEIVLPQYI